MPFLNGTLLRDADRNAIQLPTGFTFTDAVLKTSPIVSDISKVVLKFPKNAVLLNLCPTDGDIKLSGVSDGYCTIKSGVWFEIPGKPGDVIYLTRESPTKIEFCFSLIV